MIRQVEIVVYRLFVTNYAVIALRSLTVIPFSVGLAEHPNAYFGAILR